MRKIHFSIILVLAALLSSCATPVQHNTASGKPEVNIRGQVAKQAKGKLINQMINKGYNIKSESNSLVVFEKAMENFMAGVLLGSRYDTTPNARISATIVENSTCTRIILNFAAVTNPGSAFEKVTQMNQVKDTMLYQDILNQIKVELE